MFSNQINNNLKNQQSSVEKRIICMNCGNCFDLPKFLPCGETICKTCLDCLCFKSSILGHDDPIIESTFCKTISNNFYCPFCHQIHIRPQEDFQTNRAILNLMSIQTAKPIENLLSSNSDSLLDLQTQSHLNVSFEMEQLLNRLKAVVNDLKKGITNSELKLKENSMLIREKINQNTASIIDELNSIRMQMLNEVDKYDNNLLFCSIDIDKEEKQFKIKELLDQTDKHLNKLHNDLKNKKMYTKESIHEEIKILEKELLTKADIIRNFFSLKDHLVFDDTNIKLIQANTDLKSLIGTISFKPFLPQVNEVDSNNNSSNCSNSNIALTPTEDDENFNSIDYSKVITDSLKLHGDVFVSLFEAEDYDNQEFVLGMNQKSEKQQRFKTHLKLLDSNFKKLEDLINFDFLLVHMQIYKKFLILLAYETDVFTLSLYNNKLKLLKKQNLNFSPSYFNVFENGIYLLVKQTEHQTDSLISVFDWDLNEVTCIELDAVLKKNRFYLNNTNDLFIINEKIFLVDKLNSRINVISCKNGDIIKEIYYKNRGKFQKQQQKLPSIQQLPKMNNNNFFIQINSFENVIVVDAVEKVLFILDNKNTSLSQNVVYKKNLSFIQCITSFHLIDNYVYMIHDTNNKIIYTVRVQ